MRGNIFLLTVLLLQSVWVPAQETRVSNGFIQDSLSVGEPVDFWLAITYPDQMEALFPDSTSTAFAPFEYMGKTYFPTRVLPGEQAYDSIVYRLQSFEIDAVQYLQLPVYLFDRRDSTTRLSGLDSIVFRDLIPLVSDTTQIRTNLQYQRVVRQFNYPLTWILLAVLLVTGLVVLLVFGKKIRTYWNIRRMQKAYARFSDQFTAQIQQLKKGTTQPLAEEAVSTWKNYFEKLENEPVSKMTTPEILALGHTSEIREALRAIDRCVYGHDLNASLYRNFQSLEDYTQHRYITKIDELKHGNNR